MPILDIIDDIHERRCEEVRAQLLQYQGVIGTSRGRSLPYAHNVLMRMKTLNFKIVQKILLVLAYESSCQYQNYSTQLGRLSSEAASNSPQRDTRQLTVPFLQIPSLLGLRLLERLGQEPRRCRMHMRSYSTKRISAAPTVSMLSESHWANAELCRHHHEAALVNDSRCWQVSLSIASSRTET